MGWIHSIPANAADRPVPPAALVAVFWLCVIAYNVFQGLYYGIRSALFMDITTPAVAATQFTAYMALQNYAIAYTSQWQGWAIERYGYPNTLLFDCILGGLPILLLPLMAPLRRDVPGDSILSGPTAGAAIPEGMAG
jgi:PAT family beta-lactamase induction signal transducer AmpG